jgi:hypothetical protein
MKDTKPLPKQVAPLFVFEEAMPALGTLFLELERILGAEPPVTMEPIKAERKRMVAFIEALSAFVRHAGRNGTVSRFRPALYLHHLAEHIDRLNDGAQHPLLTATARPGRRSEAPDVWAARQYVCASLECSLRERKLSAEAIAKNIATKNPIFKRLIWNTSEAMIDRLPTAKLKDRILYWHRELQRGENAEQADMWRMILEELDASPLPLPARGIKFLEMARDAANRIVLPSGKK